MSNERTFVMTVDVDSWSSLLKFYSVSCDYSKADRQVNVNNGTQKLLQLFNKHDLKATFFVPGEVAEENSFVIKEIGQYDHEIACHGFVHEKNECLLNKESQRYSIREGTRKIRERIGSQPRGFRAPCLRANQTTLEVLTEQGYTYDSSLAPTFVPGYYGRLRSPLRPHYPSLASTEREKPCKILELPLSVNPLIPLPLGAAWMRNLGLRWVKFGMKMNFVLGNPVVFYVHPRDVVSLPKVKGVPWHLYRNVGEATFGMLDETIRYAKKLGATFMKAIELAQNFQLEQF